MMPKRLADKIAMTKNLSDSLADLLPPGVSPPSFLRPSSA